MISKKLKHLIMCVSDLDDWHVSFVNLWIDKCGIQLQRLVSIARRLRFSISTSLPFILICPNTIYTTLWMLYKIHTKNTRKKVTFLLLIYSLKVILISKALRSVSMSYLSIKWYVCQVRFKRQIKEGFVV